MATASISVGYRPLRIGFLVREACVEDVLKAAEISTALWGGIYNPFIAVGNDEEIGQLIHAFGVDVLHPVVATADVSGVLDRHRWLTWPERLNDSGLLEGSDRGRMGVLDVVPIFRRYWKEEFRRPDARSNCLHFEWKPDDLLGGMFTVQFGRFPSSPMDYADAYLKAMKPRVVEIAGEIPVDIIGGVTPLGVSRDSLTAYANRRGGWFGMDGVFVGAPASARDLISFWNLRASGIKLAFLPRGHHARVRRYVVEFLQHMHDRQKQRGESESLIGVWHTGEDSPVGLLKEIGEGLAPEGSRMTMCHVEEATWNGLNVVPPSYVFERTTVLGNVEQGGKGGYIATFALPEKPAVGEDIYEDGRQLLVAQIQAYGEHEYTGHTLHPPYLPDMSAELGKYVLHDRRNFRLGHDGISVIVHLRDDVLQVVPLSFRSLIGEVFLRAGLKAEPSQPGRIAERLIQQMSGLEGCRVFKITGVRRLIEGRAAREGIARNAAVQTIIDRAPDGRASFERHKDLYIVPREKPQLDPQDVFDYLLRRRVLRTGLILECPHCTLNYWLPVDNVRERSVCEYCGHSFLIGPLLRGRGDWRFRLTGLFGRDNHQEGSVPVVLALLQLLREHHGFGTFLYTTALNLEVPGFKCEVDFAVLNVDSWGEPTMVIGECKQNKDITRDDVANLLRVRKAVRKSGVDCFVVLSKLAASFSESERSILWRLREQRVPFILFTERELEPYDPYMNLEEAQEASVPHRYAVTFEEMAENSSFRYLTSPDAPGGEIILAEPFLDDLF